MKKLIFALIILLIPSLVWAFPPMPKGGTLGGVNVWTGTNTFNNNIGIDITETVGLGINTGVELVYRPTLIGSGAAIMMAFNYGFHPIVPTTSLSAWSYGGYLETKRNAVANTDDDGTITDMYNFSLVYGHGNSNGTADPQTVRAYGLYISPYFITGDVTSFMADLYIDSGTVSITPAARWGIYQESASAPNYFAGDVTLAGGNINTGNIPLVIGDNMTDSITLRTDGGDVTVPEGTITLLDTTTAASTYAPIASPALTGDSTLTDATPTFTLQDSDNAAGTAGFYANSSGGANGINFSLGVEEDAGAANTAYINLNGTADNKVVALQKDLTLLNGDVIRTNATTEGHTFAFQVYDNTANQWKPALTFTNGITGAYKVSLGAGVTFDGLGSLSLGSVIMGDTTPDAEGEFGYASNQLSIHDGTASRSLLQVASTTITKSELIPIEWAEDGATAPAAAAQVGTTDLIARSFAEDADNDVIIYWQLPLDYSAGVKYRVYYALNANGVADETAAFALSGISITNSESLAGAMGDAVVVSDEIGENDDTSELMVSDWSGAVTLGGTPAAGEMAKLTFIRDVSGDDVADHLLVAFIEIKYQAKVNASTDY